MFCYPMGMSKELHVSLGVSPTTTTPTEFFIAWVFESLVSHAETQGITVYLAPLLLPQASLPTNVISTMGFASCWFAHPSPQDAAMTHVVSTRCPSPHLRSSGECFFLSFFLFFFFFTIFTSFKNQFCSITFVCIFSTPLPPSQTNPPPSPDSSLPLVLSMFPLYYFLKTLLRTVHSPTPSGYCNIVLNFSL